MSPFYSMEISGFGMRTWVVNGGDLWRSSVRLQVAEWYKGRMVFGGSGKVSFGRRIRAGPYLRIQSELYTHSEVVSSPK